MPSTEGEDVNGVGVDQSGSDYVAINHMSNVHNSIQHDSELIIP